MTELTDPAYFRDHIRRERNLRSCRIVEGQVRKIIQPFDPGVIDIFVESTFLRIHISSSTFIDEPYKVDGDALTHVATEDEMAAWLGIWAGRHWLSLMNEPVPDNIILGEY